MSFLALGQYIGRVPRSWSAESLQLSVVVHEGQRVNDSHAHEAAFVTMMLGGAYVETAGRRFFPFDRFSAIYHSAGIEHHDAVGGGGTRLLIFEFRSRLTEGIEHHGSTARVLRDLSGSRAAFDILRLYRGALGGQDDLEFESQAFDLIGRMTATARARKRDLPSALRARDFVHAHFRDRVAMKDVARAAGVHPVYLGQAFRREFGETIGQAVMRLRARAAADALSRSDAPLATLALDLGFYDQSHFHRAFRNLTGVTPARFRRIWRNARA